MIDIIRNGTKVLNLNQKGKRVIESASLNRALLSDDSVTLRVKSNSVLDVRINDYFVYGKSIYRINALPQVNKISNSEYDYDITAQGLIFDLLRCKFFNADETDFKSDLEFPLIGTMETFLLCLKANMKRLSLDWEIGKFTNGETKTLTFGDDSCLSALQKICAEFKTDFWIKVENEKFVIHTGDFGRKLPLTFQYGKNKGLYSLNRSNVDDNDIINRLYVSGGSENIPNAYRNFSTRLKLPLNDYIEDSNAIAYFGLKEGSISFDEIYPKRTGKITALGDTKYKFIDNTMDFDLNEKETDNITTKYLIAGTSAKVHFNTGNLAGYEFEIKKGGYNHSTKTFEIIPFKNDSGQNFPDIDSEAFQFEVGDEYVILDIVMPDSYIENAEEELLAKGLEQFELHRNAKVTYDLEVDPEYMKKIGAGNFDIGDYVRIIDEDLNIDKVLRINSTTVNFIENGIFDPNRYKIVIADSYEIDYASQVVLDIKEIKNVLGIIQPGQINFSMLGAKTTTELKNLTFDPDGYFNAENIKPNSIETNMIAVGAQSQQLSCSVVFNVNLGGQPNEFKAEAGQLFSQTYDKTWNISEKTLSLPDDEYRYVYASCDKNGITGEIILSQEKIKFDSDVNDFYFLIGILHTVVDGVRIFSLTIGTTTINGGLIRTGIISSLDGQTYFNLETGTIFGKIVFGNGSDFTTVDGGLILTKKIMVSDDIGFNGGMTAEPFLDYGSKSVAMWFGSTHALRNTAPFRVTRDGQVALESKDANNIVKGLYLENGAIIWRDENGIMRRIINMTLDQRFSANGTLLYEVNETGFHSYAVPEGWVNVSIFSFGITSEIQSDNELTAMIFDLIIKEDSLMSGGKYMHIRKFDENITAFYYSPGNVDSGNLVHEGYKTTNTDKTANVPDGWYTKNVGILASGLSNSFSTTYTFTVEMVFIKVGKITQTRNITVNI